MWRGLCGQDKTYVLDSLAQKTMWENKYEPNLKSQGQTFLTVNTVSDPLDSHMVTPGLRAWGSAPYLTKVFYIGFPQEETWIQGSWVKMVYLESGLNVLVEKGASLKGRQEGQDREHECVGSWYGQLGLSPTAQL